MIGPAPLCCGCSEYKRRRFNPNEYERTYCVVDPDGKKPSVPFNETCPAYMPKHPERETERLALVAWFNATKAELAARR